MRYKRHQSEVATFYKVSDLTFICDLAKCEPAPFIGDADILELHKSIKFPTRATKSSAGYDIFSPFSFTLQPGESIQFPTGIRAQIDEGWFLMIVPKSGLGCSYRTMLWNTVPVIDGDYFNTENGGDIILKLIVDGDRPLTINAGDKIMQGLLLPYGVTYNDDVHAKRVGGFNSTGR